jgi:hypothetical protein
MRYLLILLLFASCYKEPISTTQTDNSKFQVEELFTFDSITVYRFQDGAMVHYFTKSETMSIRSCGKNCHYSENVKNYN